jgi:hypothetical protein
MARQFSPPPVSAPKQMALPEAIAEVIKEKRITRLSWNPKTNDYCLLADGWLTIRTNNTFHKWLINDGDLLATDWVVVK